MDDINILLLTKVIHYKLSIIITWKIFLHTKQSILKESSIVHYPYLSPHNESTEILGYLVKFNPSSMQTFFFLEG